MHFFLSSIVTPVSYLQGKSTVSICGVVPIAFPVIKIETKHQYFK